jgi:transcriptional regulator with XRE-family HTH domain
MADLGDFIKKVRKANSLTQEELAALCDVSQSAIVKYESGTDPGIKFLRGFRELFGYDLVDKDITAVTPELRYDKNSGKSIFKIEKSGNLVVPDHLLTQFEKSLDAIKTNWQSIEPYLKPDLKEETGGPELRHSKIHEDKSQKAGKR